MLRVFFEDGLLVIFFKNDLLGFNALIKMEQGL